MDYMQLKIKTFFFKYVNEINTRSTRLIQSNALYILTGRHNIPEDFFFNKIRRPCMEFTSCISILNMSLNFKNF